MAPAIDAGTAAMGDATELGKYFYRQFTRIK